MRRYLITGASSGIGEAIARVLVARGDSVYGLARGKDELDRIAGELGERFLPFKCDVTDEKQVANVCGELPELPDVAILNAGIPIMEMPGTVSLEDHQKLFAVNYFGAVAIIDALMPAFVKRKSGTFVGMSSLAAYRGLPNGALYSASKAALSAAMESMRLTHHRTGVEFLVVHPGFVNTPINQIHDRPMPFLWSPEKAAKHIVKRIDAGKLNTVFPWPMRLLVAYARTIPSPIYRLFMKL
jgi:NAD(P)-dependent dehydrogenase (short-subunit alcohol dehydrogenase family)